MLKGRDHVTRTSQNQFHSKEDDAHAPVPLQVFPRQPHNLERLGSHEHSSAKDPWLREGVQAEETPWLAPENEGYLRRYRTQGSPAEEEAAAKTGLTRHGHGDHVRDDGEQSSLLRSS